MTTLRLGAARSASVSAGTRYRSSSPATATTVVPSVPVSVLSAKSAAEMTRTQTGDLKTGFVDGMSFGYGWAVVKEPTGVTGMLSPGTAQYDGPKTALTLTPVWFRSPYVVCVPPG